MRKVGIFGASKGGENTYRYLKRKHKGQEEILFFVDNDVKKHGQMLKGLPIIAPSQIEEWEPDRLYIGSTYINEIVNQLRDMDFDQRRIEFVDHYVLNPPSYRGCILWSLLCIAIVTWLLL